jgi:hypothetical protein
MTIRNYLLLSAGRHTLHEVAQTILADHHWVGGVHGRDHALSQQHATVCQSEVSGRDVAVLYVQHAECFGQRVPCDRELRAGGSS